MLGLTNKTIGGIVIKNLTAQAVYTADIYLRLSDDDGDKPESNSIKNQREFITEFLKSMPEIRIHAERKDDGFSGVDFVEVR